jgi:hypothetical protein
VRVHGELDQVAQRVGRGHEQHVGHAPARAADPELALEGCVECPPERELVAACAVAVQPRLDGVG